MNPLRLCVVALCGLALSGCGGSDSEPRTVADGTRSVAEILRGDERFETLVEILEAASVMSGPPGSQTRLGSAIEIMDRPDWQHTIFAPTDEAFEALDEATRESLLEETNATALARSHTVPTLLPSDEIETGSVTTIRGVVPVTVDSEGITFGRARVVEADIRGTNGIVHVVDRVSLPPG